MATNNGYHTSPTGPAKGTADTHAACSASSYFKLFGACFCPFVQRIWIQLELLSKPYVYYEVDPYAKPKDLVSINPKGLVPSLQHFVQNEDTFELYESTVIIDYLEDLEPKLLQHLSPQRKARTRLHAHWINNVFVPSFYRYLQATTTEGQTEHGGAFADNLAELLNRADQEGPFFSGKKIGYVDVLVAPWLLRIPRVLKPYRGFDMASAQLSAWTEALEQHPAVHATISTDDLYLDSYKRYAENRPNTSQVANAINKGHALP